MNQEQSVACRICGHTQGHRIHQARETMYGADGTFFYLECAACGCLQLLDIPADLGAFYPSDYCSFGRAKSKSIASWRRWLKSLRTRMLLGQGGVAGRLLKPFIPLPPYGDWMQRLSMGLDARILDVGCGSGHLLLRLQKDGFSALAGIDPYLPERLEYPGALVVNKQRIEALDGVFDLIMLHHAFEHMDHPREVLATLVQRLAPGGKLLIRIPLAGSYAWRKYGVSWANLDAPRHLFLHTPRSLSLLAASVGLRIATTLFDSQYKQIALSEWISLGGTMANFDQGEKAYFTAKDLSGFKRLARALNAQRDGDCAAFILERSVSVASCLTDRSS
ncbi:class I SAM-dependent methyltransferase [Lamprocystis purpurea]|uniref:class I SAM-dependent methyltransferase n=1 Tax=Lamprocystis purpurea TaxID=61598 RepID=UPI000366ED11|nr:class I SAM-dependent methyltransferase [Lamprocystis purpurea]